MINKVLLAAWRRASPCSPPARSPPTRLQDRLHRQEYRQSLFRLASPAASRTPASRSAANSSSSRRRPPRRPRRSRSSRRRSSAASNVIAIAPNSPDAMNQVLDEARAKGILVLAVNGDLVGNEEPPRRQHPAGRLHQDRPEPGRAHGLADRLQGRHRHPLGHDRGAGPEHLDRRDEEDPRRGSEVQGHEAGRHRLRRRPAGEVDERDGGAALQLPRPRGRHRADDRGRGGGGAGGAVPRHRRQGPRDRPRPAQRDARLRQGRHRQGLPALVALQRGLARRLFRRRRAQRHDQERARHDRSRFPTSAPSPSATRTS